MYATSPTNDSRGYRLPGHLMVGRTARRFPSPNERGGGKPAANQPNNGAARRHGRGRTGPFGPPSDHAKVTPSGSTDPAPVPDPGRRLPDGPPADPTVGSAHDPAGVNLLLGEDHAEQLVGQDRSS